MAPGIELPGVPAALLGLLQEAAGDQRLALVGGAVRDLLLHRVHNDPWRGLPDLDLVVEGSAAVLVARLQAMPQAAVVSAQPHGAYGTVELELQLAGQAVLLDVATARSEQYPQLGENPQVRFGALEQDLARRDFTINAMALVLASGQLLDPHGGQQDLQRRQLRWLHAGSVADDPTRLVRGARYGARLGFDLAPESQLQARRTLETWPWSWQPGDPTAQAPSALGTRLRMELELLLAREPWPQALALLQQWGALQLLDAELQAEPAQARQRRLRWAQRFGLPLLPALVAGAAAPLALAERLQLPHRDHKLLAQWLELRRRWQQQLTPVHAAATEASPPPCWHVAQWTRWLEAAGLSPEAVSLELATGGVGLQQLPLPRRPLLRWWLRWRHLKAPLSAAELMAAEGLRPGPSLGERLRQLRAERLAQERC
jgi:poly(A) polymerase